MPKITLRFKRGDSWLTGGIGFDERFWATHVEAVMPDGRYLGAHLHGGVQMLLPDYDEGKWKKQLFVDLPCTEAQQKAHHDYLIRRIGTPYDWMAIVGFAAHLGSEWHTTNHMICSALIHVSLRQPEAPWFPYPLAIPAHLTSPAILAVVLSGIVLFGDPEERT